MFCYIRSAVLVAVVLMAGIRAAQAQRTTPAPFNHPALHISMEEIAFTKQMLAQKKEPWVSALAKLKADEFSNVNMKILAIDTLAANYPNQSADREHKGTYELKLNARGVYQMSLLWCLTGDSAYAKKAMAIIEAWSAKFIVALDWRNTQLWCGWHGKDFAWGAELLKHTWGGWTPQVEQNLIAMMDRTFVTLLNKTVYDRQPTVEDPNSWTVVIGEEPREGNRKLPLTYRLGNYCNSELETLVAIALFKNDRAAFDRAINHFRVNRINYVWKNGMVQETCRDIMHSQMGLNGLIHIAEMAWHQGVDLFSVNDNALRRALEYHAPILLGGKPPVDPQCPIFSNRFSASGWEIAINHYVNRRKLAMAQSEALLKKNRPDGGEFGTLMHYNSGDRGPQTPLRRPFNQCRSPLRGQETDASLRRFDTRGVHIGAAAFAPRGARVCIVQSGTAYENCREIQGM